MKLPIIKQVVYFIEQNDEDYILETIETLEFLCEAPSISDQEIDTIGEIISNLYGAIEVNKDVKNGMLKRDALNNFMKRVTASVDS